MCGFVGFVGTFAGRETVLRKMSARIAHRGPDSEGVYIGETLALAHRRLAILDTDRRADQPMTSRDGNVTLVYNGELYNCDTLRDELCRAGYTFDTTCDTEVLLYGYLAWGADVVHRLRGMFAFVLYDKRTDTLFGARDRFGIKPFYYTTCRGNLLVASEYKAFLAHPHFVPRLRTDALAPYLTFEYNPESECFLAGVFALPPAHTLTLSHGNLRLSRYADLLPTETAPQSSETIHAVVAASVKAHSKSDVPLGSFLSGGVDSGYLTALLAPKHVFSVGFDRAKFNECNLAGDLCHTLGLTNTRQILSVRELLSVLSDVQYHMDEPMANPSAVPLWYLSRLAAQKVKVVLSGEGADELFAGYDAYLPTPAAASWARMPSALRHTAATLAWRLPRGHLTDLFLHGAPPRDGFLGEAYLAAPNEARKLLRTPYKNSALPHEIIAPFYDKVKDAPPLLQKQYLDLSLWLPCDILQKADKMTMAHSLELRVPFLDTAVFDIANRIPAAERTIGGIGKVPLRRAAESVLPHAVAWRAKKGFPVPIQDALRTPCGQALLRVYFASDAAGRYFERTELAKLANAHQHGANNGRLLYAILCFLLWEERYLQQTDSTLAAHILQAAYA